ncbi:MAG TPA: tetratricopeptide repeat protein [Fluviicola sp.]|nr:tetratricopeptide repeat protein [Fluviicola sp.]
MKNSKNWFLLAAVALTTGFSFAQKAVETSAAVEYKNNFQGAFMQQDMEKAKSSLKKAKEFIDQAAVHPDTKESPKTLYLKGEIYFYAVLLKGMDSTAFPEITEQSMDEAIASWNKAYTISNKFDADVEESIQQKKGLIDMGAVAMYNGKQYKEAMAAYDFQAQLSTAINKIDTTAIYFAGICAENDKDWDNAVKYYSKCADYGYKVPEIYKTVASALIQAGKTAEATTYLEKAIEKAPNDKELHYVIGTFYMEAGEDAKATESLRKAVAIDPKYWDAQYQLGAHLQSQGTKLRTEANNLKLNDPNFDKLIAESDEFYKQAAVPLEAYIAAIPDDKAVLTCLSQIHRALKNNEKALEYKRRLDELK